MKAVLAIAVLLAGCATGPMTEEERDSADRTIKALEVLNAGFGYKQQPQAQAKAFLKTSYVSGFNRICVYDRLGSQYIVTLRSVDICPLTQ